MLNRIFIYLSKKRPLLVFSCLSLILVLVSCSSKLVSPNGLFKAVKVRENDSTHYQVIGVSTGNVILTTRAQYDTPNDVKGGGFSADSKQFAAVYHYGHGGTYTWIGVWSTETGEFLYFETRSGFTTNLAGFFDKYTAIPLATSTKTKSATTATATLKAPPTLNIIPITAFMKGIAYTSWQSGEYSNRQSDTTLSQVIKPMGVNWLSLIVTCYQEEIASSQIQCKTDSLTPTDDDLFHTIQYAHSLGIQVMLKPHVDLSNDPNHWRGEIDFGNNETAWEAWFDSYTKFITHYAALAQDMRADYFAVGTELKGTSQRADQWRSVINAVREKYKGPILYAANWNEEANIIWWDAVDAIGVDAFYPLTQSNEPTIIHLKAGWSPIVLHLGQLSKTWNRPVVFTEIGYRSFDGTNREPYNYQISGQIDLQEQADCYQAVFDAFAGQDWWRGVFWWNWIPNTTQGGPADSDYTANNKPAENILRMNYGAPPRPTPTAPPRPTPTTSPSPMPTPPYRVEAMYNTTGIHCRVIETKSNQEILTTHAQYSTYNDVKNWGFSSDWKKFAAVYHYGHEENYTWIGVWSTETGQFLYSVRKSGWTSDLSGVFDEQP